MKSEFELPTEPYNCKHLGEKDSDVDDIKCFTIDRKEGQGLLNYLLEYSFEEEKQGLSRTYLVRESSTGELVGYFSLKASMITVNERPNAIGDITFDTIPAIELSNFAANDTYKNKHPELEYIGELIFARYVLPIAKQAAMHFFIAI